MSKLAQTVETLPLSASTSAAAKPVNRSSSEATPRTLHPQQFTAAKTVSSTASMAKLVRATSAATQPVPVITRPATAAPVQASAPVTAFANRLPLHHPSFPLIVAATDQAPTLPSARSTPAPTAGADRALMNSATSAAPSTMSLPLPPAAPAALDAQWLASLDELLDAGTALLEQTKRMP